METQHEARHVAARRNTPTLNDGWKQKIQTSMLINRLQDCGLGKIDLKPTQVDAIKILLRKTTPDLATVSTGQDPNLGPLKVTWEK